MEAIMTDRNKGPAGTTDQRPRWEGPPENRPRGYLPAQDDPESEPDAAGETLPKFPEAVDEERADDVEK
ncbi:MAG: hypothetical protein M9939_07545 [Mesorhizobium sp.]|nr:hypothetical protein [Mesorhizobium sp.]MCO5160974.1 hypothetical protein [Mesorhizobium sp.]